MPKSIQVAIDLPTGVKTQNIAWRTPSYPATDLGKLRCNLAINIDARVQYTIDDGTNWLFLNGGADLKANCSYGFDIYIRAGDLVNFRTPDTGVTVILARLDSIKDEG